MHVWLPKGYPQPETMLTTLEQTYGSLKDIYYPPSSVSEDVIPSSDTNDNGPGLGPGQGPEGKHMNNDGIPSSEIETRTIEPLIAMSTQGWTDRQQYLFKQSQASRYLEGGDLHATLSRKNSNLAFSQKSAQGARSLKVMTSSSQPLLHHIMSCHIVTCPICYSPSLFLHTSS